MDVANMGAKKVLVVTDKNLSVLPTFRVLLDALTRQRVDFEVWDETRVEPTDDRLVIGCCWLLLVVVGYRWLSLCVGCCVSHCYYHHYHFSFSK